MAPWQRHLPYNPDYLHIIHGTHTRKLEVEARVWGLGPRFPTVGEETEVEAAGSSCVRQRSRHRKRPCLKNNYNGTHAHTGGDGEGWRRGGVRLLI